MGTKVAGLGALAVLVFAQPDAPPRFEAEEVRVSKSDGRTDISIVNGQLRMIGVTMRRMITMAYAYTIREDDLRGGPRWLDSDRFDVVAKASGAPEPKVLAMLQTLLGDRFKLKTHFEVEPRLVYVLSVADIGANLKPASTGEPSSCKPSSVGPEQVRVVCTNVTMGSLARRLPPLTNLELPVVDTTELKGTYDFQLDWTWGAPLDPAAGGQGNRPTAEGLGNSVKHLGLLLERRKHPIPVLVVDSVDRAPAE